MIRSLAFEVSRVTVNPARLIDQADGATNIVRGCPCYREFGEEKVCLNNDSVYPIRAISVDPSFFNSLQSKDNLAEFQSGNDTMCYLITFLDRKEGYCYCVSQNKRIRINNTDVKASEIDSALQFVTSSEKQSNGVLCSDCLYRYLRTMGESSEGFLTEDERTEIIDSYVRNLANTMAIQLSSYDDSNGPVSLKEHLPSYINELNRSRSHWISMIRNLRSTKADSDLIRLIESYSTLSRLESVFLFQVQALEDDREETHPLDALHFMVNVSERVMSTNDEIRERTNDLMNRNAIPAHIQEMLSQHSQKRKETEYRFSNLVSVLHEIDSSTSQ
jgi:hypothetical protein